MDAVAVGQHYRCVADAFAQVLGADITLDIARCEAWAPRAVGRLLYAAFPSVFAATNDDFDAKVYSWRLCTFPHDSNWARGSIVYAWHAGRDARAAAAAAQT